MVLFRKCIILWKALIPEVLETALSAPFLWKKSIEFELNLKRKLKISKAVFPEHSVSAISTKFFSSL